MTNLQKARLYRGAGVVFGGIGAASSYCWGPRLGVAFSFFVFGSTVTLLWLTRHLFQRFPEE